MSRRQCGACGCPSKSGRNEQFPQGHEAGPRPAPAPGPTQPEDPDTGSTPVASRPTSTRRSSQPEDPVSSRLERAPRRLDHSVCVPPGQSNPPSAIGGLHNPWATDSGTVSASLPPHCELGTPSGPGPIRAFAGSQTDSPTRAGFPETTTTLPDDGESQPLGPNLTFISDQRCRGAKRRLPGEIRGDYPGRGQKAWDRSVGLGTVPGIPFGGRAYSSGQGRNSSS